MARSTIEQWRMFKAVADFGGFQQAADHVHKSQSTVHHAVNKLEEQLGVQLIEVQGRKTQITPAGQQLLRRITYLLAETERFENVAKNLKQGVESRLAIAVDEAFPKSVLYQALAEVSKEFPLVHIEVIETILNGANELLNKGVAEIALSPFTLANELSEDLCQMEFMAVCGAKHPLAQKHNVTPEDLKQYRQIVLRDSGQERQIDVGWLGSEQRWTVSHMATSIELIQKNLGFAWLPKTAIAESLQYGVLTPIQLTRGATRTLSLFLNFRDAQTLGPVARSFIGHVRYFTE
ncbi:LysR family transcriptional regulator [Pseudidiomarina woesei]|uniref:DNA-binding transcriptional regulator, LysR family n=1 Tax=Pseudidiomarina woesei TaxID=1381080 RepID=A0A0K6H4I3_9GAMM|nr:LysR family transcriptional regulator [Pseudidiomarina woesei]CUA85816.1 DNA-binding transcriptional regulator, LysR family [Pseudidiomarina woesei]